MKSNKIINITKSLAFAMCFLVGASASAQEQTDSLINIAFGKTSKIDMMDGISEINVAELMKKDYHTYSLGDLHSLVGGYNGNIWGQAPLVLVDGVPRDASTIKASEVETITIMKGASAVVLYGSKGAKGVVLISTKRGKAQKLTIEASANTGLSFAKRYPKYLGSAQYMTLYNEACSNDGVNAQYSEQQIANSTAGNNPYAYPDMNLYGSDFLRDAKSTSNASMEVVGGNSNAKYYANFGVTYSNDFVKYGDKKNDNNLAFDIRSNIDMRITSWMKAFANVKVNIANDYIGSGNYWGATASLRPNWYTPLIPISMVDPNNKELQAMISSSSHIIDGQYLLGGTSTDRTTVFGDMLAAGYTKNKNRTFSFDVGVNVDLSMLLKGLEFKTAYSIDYWDNYTEAYSKSYAVYQPVWNETEDMIVDLKKYGEDKSSTSEYIGKSYYNQTMTFRSQFDYNKTFNDVHNISASLVGWGYQIQVSEDDGSAYHRTSNANLGLRASYNYNHLYYAELGGALAHTAKLAEGKRNALSPSMTLGWRIGEEKWFKNALPFVDDAKINTSYAILNQDIDISDYYMYKGYYNNRGGWYTWKDGAEGGYCNTSSRGENLELGFIKRKELRVGLQASMFNKMITVDANYFNQTTDGLLTQGASTVYPSYFTGNGSFLPYLNYNQDSRKGFDFAVYGNKKIGEVDASLGLTGLVLSTNAKKRDEVYSDPYQYRVGHALNTQWGYVCEGFFNDQTDIDNHAKQTFGEVKPGDLKYKDINEDGAVDSKDEIDLGKGSVPFYYGVNLTLKWKQFTMFALGTGQMGGVSFKTNDWIDGSDKYTTVVLGRWTPETAGVAKYPRLTQTTSNNNFRNSTFWRYSTDVFRLNKVQLTYDLPSALFANKVVSAMSLYCSGENLLNLGGNAKYMETNYGSAPQTRFYNLGVKLTF